MTTAIKRVLQETGAPLIRVAPTATVFEAIEIMCKAHVGSVLVMDEKDKLKGILTERDCFCKVILSEKAPRKTKVAEVMSKRVIVVAPDQTMEECMGIMTKKHIRHLPVMDVNTVLGVVSMRDIVRVLTKEQDQMIRNLERYIDGSL